MRDALCKICQNSSDCYGETKLLNKYQVSYFKCRACGFIQTEEPYWLDEAYTKAINHSDVGILSRNKHLADTSRALINLYFNRQGRFLDYGGGYGIFVRMMRDFGFDFYRYDRYCENLFANGHDFSEAGPGQFELLTSFELFEHLAEPRDDVSRMKCYADNMLFTTNLLPAASPKLDEWWYFGKEHGQHISFYTRKSLEILAESLSLKLVSNNSTMHLFTSRSIPAALFSRITQKPMLTLLINKLYKSTSLAGEDYNKAVVRMFAGE